MGARALSKRGRMDKGDPGGEFRPFGESEKAPALVMSGLFDRSRRPGLAASWPRKRHRERSCWPGKGPQIQSVNDGLMQATRPQISVAGPRSRPNSDNQGGPAATPGYRAPWSFFFFLSSSSSAPRG